MSKKFVLSRELKKFTQSQLAIPVFALLILVVFNLFRDPSFFSISIKTNNLGNATQNLAYS